MKALNKKRKQLGSVVAAFAILVALMLTSISAAGFINLSKNDCQLTIRMDQVLPEGVNPQVKIYKVADFSGENDDISFTNTEKFKGIDFNQLVLKRTGESSIEENWKTLAKKAYEGAGNAEPVATQSLQDDGTGVSSTKFSNLPVGLYLICADTVQTDTYEYLFSPYLVSLPLDDSDADAENPSWNYVITSTMKMEQKLRTGKLGIRKTLKTFKENSKETTFVFQVEAKKADPVTNEEKVVYSNVVSASFTKTGSKEVILEGIPVGAKVTVTEVYSGASYKNVSEASKTAVIVGDENFPTVDFTNDYDGNLNNGYGVTNHFEYNSESEDFEWTQLKDNTVEQK